MGFFVLGVSHKACPVNVRERLFFSGKQIESALAEVTSFKEVTELVILSTCNRVEFYGFSEKTESSKDAILSLIEKYKDIKREEIMPYLYEYENRSAIRHLFRVVAGLDSLALGENEILGQVREAFRRANQSRSVQSFLYRLMEKSLKIGKDVRTETRINEGAVSIPSVAVELAEKIFGHLSGNKVMMLGTGEMSSLTLSKIREAGAEILYVVSRNRESGEKVALDYGAEWIPLEEWDKHMPEVDIVIASTAAPHIIIKKDKVEAAMKKRRHKPCFLIDIAVPRNIDCEINSLDDVYVYNIDDLKGVSDSNLRLRKGEIHQAGKLIDAAVESFQSWLEQLSAKPTLQKFQDYLDDLLETELTSFAKRNRLEDKTRDELKERLQSKLLHAPREKIKEASMNGGVARYVEALHSLFNLDKKPKNKE